MVDVVDSNAIDCHNLYYYHWELFMIFKVRNWNDKYQVTWLTGADGIIELTVDKAQAAIVLARGLGVKTILWDVHPFNCDDGETMAIRDLVFSGTEFPDCDDRCQVP
jgi:hypothetical protein